MMNENEIQKELYRQALELIEKRYPNSRGGAAAAYTAEGRFLTSVPIDTIDTNVELCCETGVICEAAKYNLKITHCICVIRDSADTDYMILSPCGVCQERLRYYGVNIKVGVTTKDHTLKFVSLDELQPFHWTTAFSDIKFYDDNIIK